MTKWRPRFKVTLMNFYKSAARTIAASLFVFLFVSGTFLSCDNSSGSVTFVPKKESDWLFLFYFDADSNINDSLYGNLRQAEAALAYARNEDGSPAQGYPSMNILVLWDGISEELKGEAKYMHPDAAVFELGADYGLKAQLDNNQFDLGDSWKLSPNTKDLTVFARSWLVQEPDMGDVKTLEGFLTWAKAYYGAKNVVINLNDHGAGTHKETYDDSTATSKSLCSDETNAAITKKSRLLTCKNVKDALAAAGYTGADKPKILWNDLCLQSTAEIVYNWAGCAEYFSASPNSSVSNYYVYLLGYLKNSYSALDFGKCVVSSYYNVWKDQTQPHYDSKINRSSGASMFTWSLISLDQSKADALKTAVENFADALLYIKESDASAFNSVYTNYVKQNKDDLSDCKGLAYCGTYAFQNDLGWLAKDVEAWAETNSYAQLKKAASELKDLLRHGNDKLIVYAWGGKRASADNDTEWIPTSITTNQMYHTGQKDFLTGMDVAVEKTDDIYGLTIVASGKYYANKSGQIVPIPAEAAPIKNYYDWTGFSQKWGQVIAAWAEAGL